MERHQAAEQAPLPRLHATEDWRGRVPATMCPSRNHTEQQGAKREVRLRENLRTDGKQVDKTMVQTGPYKEERHIPYIPPHLLRNASEPRHTAIHGPAADVPQRYQHNRDICRLVEQDKVQSPKKAAGVYGTITMSSRFILTYNTENQY